MGMSSPTFRDYGSSPPLHPRIGWVDRPLTCVLPSILSTRLSTTSTTTSGTKHSPSTIIHHRCVLTLRRRFEFFRAETTGCPGSVLRSALAVHEILPVCSTDIFWIACNDLWYSSNSPASGLFEWADNPAFTGGAGWCGCRRAPPCADG